MYIISKPGAYFFQIWHLRIHQNAQFGASIIAPSALDPQSSDTETPFLQASLGLCFT